MRPTVELNWCQIQSEETSCQIWFPLLMSEWKPFTSNKTATVFLAIAGHCHFLLNFISCCGWQSAAFLPAFVAAERRPDFAWKTKLIKLRATEKTPDCRETAMPDFRSDDVGPSGCLPLLNWRLTFLMFQAHLWRWQYECSFIRNQCNNFTAADFFCALCLSQLVGCMSWSLPRLPLLCPSDRLTGELN